MLECSALSHEEAWALFGTQGSTPPQSLSALIGDMLNQVSAAPDKNDAAELRSLVRDLKDSLAKVETMIARLQD